MIRICPNCRKRREFGNRQGYCKKCRATAHRTKYHSDPVFRYNQIKRTSLIVKRNYAQYKKWKDGYLRTHPCVDCGNTDIRVLEFDHRNDTDKKFAICNGAVHSTEKLLEEVAKCDVRCANCHNIKHYNEFRTGAYARKKKI